MLKFSEMPYERPDLDELRGKMQELIRELKAADGFDAAKAAFIKEDELVRHVMTVRTLATIRHSIDTRDTFYAVVIGSMSTRAVFENCHDPILVICTG